MYVLTSYRFDGTVIAEHLIEDHEMKKVVHHGLCVGGRITKTNKAGDVELEFPNRHGLTGDSIVAVEFFYATDRS